MSATPGKGTGNPRRAASPGFGLAAAGLWILGLWLAGVSTVLGHWQLILLAASGLPLLALLLGLHRALPAAAREACALAAPLGMFWSLNQRALGFWWVGDDPCHLVQVLDDGIWRPFVDPVGYFLTPLLNFSLGLDFELFGLDPHAFYVHQLMSFSLLLVVGHGFLRGDLKPAAASLALTIFVASAPALAVAQLQMNRHYLEGMLLMLASFACYRLAVRRGRWCWAVAGAGLYLLATAAKEVFVPMVLCLPFLAGGGPRLGDLWRHLRGGWRYGIPYALVVAFYACWRLSMLGPANSMTAYGALSGDFENAGLLRRGPRILGLGEPWQALAAAAVLAAAVWVLARRSRVFGAGLAVTLVGVAVPLIPVFGRLQPRHLLMAAFAAGAVIAAAVDLRTTSLGTRWHLRARAVAGAGLLILALAALVRSPAWTGIDESAQRYRAEGRFLLDESRDGMLLTKLPHSHYLQCLSRLGRDLLGQELGPGFCGDLCYCSRTFPGESFWEVIGGRIVPVKRTAAADCDAGRPLIVDLRHDALRGQLSWRLEPEDGGSWQALLLSDIVRPGVSIPIVIPPRGSIPFRLEEPLHFVVRYRSAEGWRTYSPVHVVESGGIARRVEDAFAR